MPTAAATLDIEHFRAMTGDDPALQAELRELFAAQAALWRRLLVADAPVQTWRDAAHTLKGSARSLGLWTLAEACVAVEGVARTGRRDGPMIAAVLDQARAALDDALEALCA